jgi:hypothetical protein
VVLDRTRKLARINAVLVDCCPLVIVRSCKGVPPGGMCIQAGRGIRGESADGNMPVARKQQEVAQEDETDRRKHHHDEPFEYPARPSERDKQPLKQRPARLRRISLAHLRPLP